MPLWNPDTWPHPCKGSWKLLYLGLGVWWQGGHHLWTSSCLCRCVPASQTAKWHSTQHGAQHPMAVLVTCPTASPHICLKTTHKGTAVTGSPSEPEPGPLAPSLASLLRDDSCALVSVVCAVLHLVSLSPSTCPPRPGASGCLWSLHLFQPVSHCRGMSWKFGSGAKTHTKEACNFLGDAVSSETWYRESLLLPLRCPVALR